MNKQMSSALVQGDQTEVICVSEGLISIDINEHQEPVVSGRQLHEVLGVKEKYADWIKRMIEYGFIENQDLHWFPKKEKPITLKILLLQLQTMQ